MFIPIRSLSAAFVSLCDQLLMWRRLWTDFDRSADSSHEGARPDRQTTVGGVLSVGKEEVRPARQTVGEEE